MSQAILCTDGFRKMIDKINMNVEDWTLKQSLTIPEKIEMMTLVPLYFCNGVFDFALFCPRDPLYQETPEEYLRFDIRFTDLKEFGWNHRIDNLFSLSRYEDCFKEKRCSVDTHCMCQSEAIKFKLFLTLTSQKDYGYVTTLPQTLI